MKKEDYAISIRRTENGFVLSYFDEVDKDEFRQREIVVEDSKGELEYQDGQEVEKLNSMKEALETIREHFGFLYSKHNKYNLRIKIEEIKGEKE